MRYVVLFFAAFAAALAVAEYQATPPRLAHSLTPEQIDAIVDRTPGDRNVAVPAWYAQMVPGRRAVATNQLAIASVATLPGIVADTRSNIVEVAALTDIEVVGLYLGQLKKPHDALVEAAVHYGLPTNTLEYLIGAGMRQDLGVNR